MQGESKKMKIKSMFEVIASIAIIFNLIWVQAAGPLNNKPSYPGKGSGGCCRERE